MLQIKFTHFDITSKIKSIHYEILKSISSKEETEMFKVNAFQSFYKYYEYNPTVSGGEYLFNIPDNNKQSIPFLFSKMISSTNNFFVLYVTLTKIYSNLDDKSKNFANEIIQRDYSPKSRNYVINYFFNPRLDPIYFLISASETDDVSIIFNECNKFIGTE